MRREKAPQAPAGSIGVPIWGVTLFYPETRVRSSTLHSAGTRREAAGKALAHVPSSAPKPTIRRAVVVDRYIGNPNDLVI